MKNLGCPLWNCANDTAQWERAQCIKSSLAGVEDFLRALLRRKAGIYGTSISTLQSRHFCSHTVLVAWLTEYTEYKKLPDFCLK